MLFTVSFLVVVYLCLGGCHVLYVAGSVWAFALCNLSLFDP